MGGCAAETGKEADGSSRRVGGRYLKSVVEPKLRKNYDIFAVVWLLGFVWVCKMMVMGRSPIPPEALKSAEEFLRNCDKVIIKEGYISRFGQVVWEERKRQAQAFVAGRDYRLPDAVAKIMQSCEEDVGNRDYMLDYE